MPGRAKPLYVFLYMSLYEPSFIRLDVRPVKGLICVLIYMRICVLTCVLMCVLTYQG